MPPNGRFSGRRERGERPVVVRANVRVDDGATEVVAGLVPPDSRAVRGRRLPAPVYSARLAVRE